MESRVVVVDGTKEFADFDDCVELFADLTAQGLLWRLSGFDLTARKLPPIFPLAISSLRSKDTSLRVKDDSGNYFYGFVHCLSYFCSGEGVGLVATEDENLAVAEELTSLTPALP